MKRRFKFIILTFMLYFSDILYHYMPYRNPDSHIFCKLPVLLPTLRALQTKIMICWRKATNIWYKAVYVLSIAAYKDSINISSLE